jgi:hypothetical protein
MFALAVIYIGLVSQSVWAAPDKPPPGPQDVNVVNTPNVTVMNPQTSVTVDNTNPIPVDVQGGMIASSEPRFVGFSTAILRGDAGYPNINQACRDSFGTGARICLASEVANTVQLPIDSTEEFAWVNMIRANEGELSYHGAGLASNCGAFKNANPGGRDYVVSRDTGEILELNDSTPTNRMTALGSCGSSYPVSCCK